MDKHYVLVAGSGTTSRANLEALVEDYFYGKNVVLLLAYKDKPSQGQVFAAQYAKDKGKDVVVFCQETSSFQGIPSATITEAVAPYETAIDFLKGQSSASFLLWSDEDEDMLTLLALSQKESIPCYDLTNGLIAITATEGVKAPVPVAMPEQEMVVEEREVEEVEEDDEDDEDEELEAEDIEDEIMDACLALADAITRSVMKTVLGAVSAEATDAPKKASKGSKA